jgi:hypothetical protein
VYLIARLGTNIQQTSNREKVAFFVDLTEFEALVRTILFPTVQRALEANKPIAPYCRPLAYQDEYERSWLGGKR